MPEQQASPSCSEPPPCSLGNPSVSKLQTDGSASSDSAKRTYLSLLPPLQLIDLILAIDANRDTCIFPLDLNSAIEALQRPRHVTPNVPVEPASTFDKDVHTTPPIKSEPSVIAIPSPSPSVPSIPQPQPPSQPSPTPPFSVPPPQQTAVTFPSTAPSTPVPPPAASPIPPPVLPPQYKPPPHKLQPQPHAVPQMYPHAHIPYYAPGTVPVLQTPPQPSTPVPPPSAPPRHPLFTSAPLTRDAANPAAKTTSSSTQVSSRDDPNAMPSYEEMLVEAIIDVGDADGTAPKVLFAWMASHYPLQQNFRPSASQALHKALRRGRLAKVGGKYRLNPEWGGGPTTSKRATRRPTAGNATVSPPTAASSTPPNPMPQAVYHATYGYHYAAHPSYSYYATPWVSGQPIAQPLGPAPAPCKVEKTDEMEEDGPESEEADPAGIASKPADVPSKDHIKQCLIRLASVLQRFAKKGEGTGTVGSKES